MDILDNPQVIAQRDPHDVLNHTVTKWSDLVSTAQWSTTTPYDTNEAKQLAWMVMGKSVVIYASEQLRDVAQHWKRAINRHAHTVAWVGAPIEQSEDEQEGWLSHPIEKAYAVIDLVSSFDSPETTHAFSEASRRLSGRRPAPQRVILHGESLSDQVTYGKALGEFMACYLAVLHGVVPHDDALIRTGEGHR